MRCEPTDAERRLWSMLRAKRLGGHKFKRQQPIDSYIADFACLEQRLIVEADGGQHSDSAYDERRDAYLRSQGFRVLRFWNDEVSANAEGVSARILEALEEPLPPTTSSRVPPSPPSGEGLRLASFTSPSPLAGEGGQAAGLDERGSFAELNPL